MTSSADKRIPLCEETLSAAAWEVRKIDAGRYCLFSCGEEESVALSSTVMIEDYSLIRLAHRGGNSLVYLALNTKTGKLCFVKESYPLRFASDGSTRRDGNEVVANNPDAEEDLRKFFEIDAELEVNEAMRFSLDETGDPVNNPRVFWMREITPKGRSARALNRFCAVESHSGKVLAEVGLSDASATARVIDALKVTKQLAMVIRQQFHERSRMHGDIQPWNVYVSDLAVDEKKCAGSHILIPIDFGSSHRLDKDGKIKDTRAIKTYSRGYAAPEVRKFSEGDCSCLPGVKSDVFSIAKVLTYLLLKDSGCIELRIENLSQSPSFRGLSPIEQSEIIDLLNKATETREIDECGLLERGIDDLIDLLSNHGISLAVMRKNAWELSRAFAEKMQIDPMLLPEIEAVE